MGDTERATPTVRAGAVQLTAGPDKDANLHRASELVARCVDDGASLVVLPELFGCMGPGPVLAAAAEPLDGPTLEWASTQAADAGIWLVAGSFVERRAGSERTANTSCLIGPDGAVVATYRKVHLFDCDVPGAEFHESSVVEPGDDLILADAGPVGVGMSVCYDLRFPELYRILALRGASVLVVPACFTARTGPPHWEVLLRARAIENQCFVVAAAQQGSSAPKLRWHGESMIIDPWGTVLARGPVSDAVDDSSRHGTVVVADLDLGRLAEVRAQLPSLANRRPSAYRWPTAPAGVDPEASPAPR
ncbi:MAG: carbon-nitrogen hydrolase family protein [Acidimicrobiales bacterium]